MPNFFQDNESIRFLFDHMDFSSIATAREENFRFAKEFDCAPTDSADAIDNYRRVLETIGEIAGDRVAPTAEETDRVGNTLNADGTVSYAPGIAEAVRLLGQAGLMGFTLPYRFGGINCPQLLYSISNDIVSRADASLMNLYGLQGIAETINSFASEEIKEQYLPRMASGELTGAMVLTEPDAGSDLQSVKTRAYQDADGNWFVRGVKRFITNGCGDVLLVLARTEPAMTDARGLSCLLVERGPRVKIRRLEHKLGINGSPTCEIFFDDAPAKLIGERKRGLISYVMSLMNGARIGIAAQSVGIGEAAYRVARDYAHSRKQYGTAIENLPAVRDLLVEANLDLQAARVITYFASWCVDMEDGAGRLMRSPEAPDADALKALRTQERKYRGWNKLLTPLAKYTASEMSMRVSNSAVAVLGGSGYMKDYPVERHLRDSRITTIYEGTTQLQVIAAAPSVLSGTLAEIVLSILDSREWDTSLAPSVALLRDGLSQLDEAVAAFKARTAQERDLHARKIVDIASLLLSGALFCDFAAKGGARQLAIARRWCASNAPRVKMLCDLATACDTSTLEDFETLAGPLPE